jgi:hypothetical protein
MCTASLYPLPPSCRGRVQGMDMLPAAIVTLLDARKLILVPGCKSEILAFVPARCEVQRGESHAVSTSSVKIKVQVSADGNARQCKPCGKPMVMT